MQTNEREECPQHSLSDSHCTVLITVGIVSSFCFDRKELNVVRHFCYLTLLTCSLCETQSHDALEVSVPITYPVSNSVWT